MRHCHTELVHRKKLRAGLLVGGVLAVVMFGGASRAAAQSPEGFPVQPGHGFPETPTTSEVPQGFLATWAVDRPPNRPDLGGNCGTLLKDPVTGGTLRGACEFPVDKLEAVMNGRMRNWIANLLPDEVLSPKWACVAAGIQTGMQEAYIWEFTVTPDVLRQNWEQSNWTREIYMDGRPHPSFMRSFYHGHSIGKVVSPTEVIVHTSNFTFDPDGWDDHSHLPTSHLKQITERYMLIDANTMQIEYTVVDPVFLKAPFTWKKQYKKTETRLVNRWDCDPAQTIPETYYTSKPKYDDDTEWQKYNPQEIKPQTEVRK